MKKTKRKPAKPKTLAYIQDWGTYTNETMVVVGLSHKEILAALKRLKAAPYVIEQYDTDTADHDYSGGYGFVWNAGGRTLLWLEDWKYDAEHLKTLVHETNHLIYLVLVKNKGFEKEMEAQAYQQQYLFSAILKRLNGRFGRGKK